MNNSPQQLSELPDLCYPYDNIESESLYADDRALEREKNISPKKQRKRHCAGVDIQTSKRGKMAIAFLTAAPTASASTSTDFTIHNDCGITDKAQALAIVMHDITTDGMWNSWAGDIVPHIVCNLPTWPKNRYLVINSVSTVNNTPAQSAVELVQNELQEGDFHYSPIIQGQEESVPADSNCFYHALLRSLSVDEKRQLLGNNCVDSVQNADITTLRHKCAQYVQDHQDEILTFIDAEVLVKESQTQLDNFGLFPLAPQSQENSPCAKNRVSDYDQPAVSGLDESLETTLKHLQQAIPSLLVDTLPVNSLTTESEVFFGNDFLSNFFNDDSSLCADQ